MEHNDNLFFWDVRPAEQAYVHLIFTPSSRTQSPGYRYIAPSYLRYIDKN